MLILSNAHAYSLILKFFWSMNISIYVTAPTRCDNVSFCVFNMFHSYPCENFANFVAISTNEIEKTFHDLLFFNE